MRTYVIDSDLADQRGTYLGFFLWTTVLVGVLLFNVTVGLLNMTPVPFEILFGALGITYLLRHKRHFEGAAWVYTLGMIATPTLVFLSMDELQPGLYVVFFLPLVLSVILLPSAVRSVTALTILAMLIGTLHFMMIGPAIIQILLPSLLVIIFSEIIQVALNQNTGFLEWAIDSEKKHAERAEMHYRQGEELKQALLDLQHISAKLEAANVHLAQAQARAEQASNAKSVFMSNMSHELRTPLNVIIGYTSSMLSMPLMYGNIPLPLVYRHDIQLIKENGEYLVGLINDILDLSKIEAGKLELHPQVVSLSDVLRGTIATSIGLLKDKPVQIIPDFPDALPYSWADPTRVRQIILNLTSNAIKFTESGSVMLTARVEDERVRISVTDTGIGIPKEVLPTIFDRFEQAEQTDQRYGGTGLGLDISQQLSRMHGGELTVESIVGQGSTFSFTVPLALEDEIERYVEPLLEERTIVEFGETVDVDGLHSVLLVEDEAEVRTMARRMLENEGYVVVDTNTGDQVFDMASGLLPSIIILDVFLPEKNGWVVLEELKADPETAPIPVIVCTVDPDQERSAALGAAYHLMKPFPAEALLSAVRHVLVNMPIKES